MARVRPAGYTDGQVGEIAADVALNLFTNDSNHLTATAMGSPAAADVAV